MPMLLNKSFVFGWVSPQIQNNFAAWAISKGYGYEEDAEKFFNETCNLPETENLDWFCIEESLEIELVI